MTGNERFSIIQRGNRLAALTWLVMGENKIYKISCVNELKDRSYELYIYISMDIDFVCRKNEDLFARFVIKCDSWKERNETSLIRK